MSDFCLMHHYLCIYDEDIWGQYAPLPDTFPNAEWFCVPIVPSYSCFLFDIEVLYQVVQVFGETHLYHDIEQLLVAYIVKGLAVINKSDEGSFFGLNQFLYHDLECENKKKMSHGDISHLAPQAHSGASFCKDISRGCKRKPLRVTKGSP